MSIGWRKKENLMKRLVLVFLLLPSLLTAKEYQVKLLTANTSGQTMIMEPAFLKISLGDSVRFIPSDATHNAESVLIPKGATAFNTPMGRSTLVEFNQEGAFLYKCTPHFALGMVGLIQVGKAVNMPEINTHWQSIKAGVVMNQERVVATLAQMNN